MELPLNRFKRAIKAGTPQIGLWAGLADPYTTEICAGAGFDWLLLDGEHGPNDLRSLLGQLQAAAPYPVHPIVRPPVGDINLIKQLLDIGAQTLLIPMVESGTQAEKMVAAMHYPPRGIRGVGSALARASRWNRVQSYLDRAGDEMCLLVQVETRAGLDNLATITATAGVVGIFIGPSDLSAGLGRLGNPTHPEVLSAIERAIARILSSGKAAGILTTDDGLARRYLSLGCTFVAVGLDAVLLANATTQLAARFKGP